MLTNTYHGGAVVRHDYHATLHDRSLMPFVAELSRSTGEEAGNVTFDDGPAIATGTGQVDLVRGALAVQPRLVQDAKHLLRGGYGSDRFDGVRNPHREDAPGVQRLAQLYLIESQGARHRMDCQGGLPRDPCDGLLDFVDQRQRIAGITGITHRQVDSQDETRCRLGDDARLPTELDRAVALAFENGGNGEIIGTDNFALLLVLALGQLTRLFTNLLMGLKGSL
jgi:hypothetical protein